MRKLSSTASMVQLTCLGTGDAFASGGRFQSGYLLATPDYRILMEAGPTILCSMKRLGLAPAQLDLILISHLHGDHFGGLPFLILEYLWESSPRKPIIIAGPRHLEERVWRLFNTLFPSGSGDIEGLRRKLKFVVIEPGCKRRIGKVQIAAIRTPHMKREASLALRITLNSKVIVFSGDSGWTDDLFPFVAGADLFLCECTYFESTQLDFHMNYPVLAENYEQFDVKRMVLTHIGREVLARRDKIALKTASDGLQFQI
jgi:ribonuclease BN (tRNA processing enzyme)